MAPATTRISASNRLRNPLVLCLLSFFFCFIVALLLFFPLASFTHQLEQLAHTQNIELEIQHPHFSFPLGLGAKSLSLASPDIPHAPLRLNNLRIQPLFLSLFSHNQGAGFSLQALQGQIEGTAQRDGRLVTTLTALEFDESLKPQLPLRLSGQLRQGNFDGQLPFTGKNISQLQLNFVNLALNGMKNLGSETDQLPIGTLTFKAESRGGIIQIKTLTAAGAAFDIQGKGSLRIGRTALRSRLNLKLTLTPKPGLDPALKDLLQLLKKPQADGRIQLNVQGALSRLRLS